MDIQAIGQKITLNGIKSLTFEEQLKAIESGLISEPVTQVYYLDSAITAQAVSIAGNYIELIEASDVNAYVDITFNKFGSGTVKFTQGFGMMRPFGNFFITATAQTGKWVKLIISSVAPELFAVKDNRSQNISTGYLADIKNALTTDAQAGLYAMLRMFSPDLATVICESKTLSGSVAASIVIKTATANKNTFISSVALSAITNSQYALTAQIVVKHGATVIKVLSNLLFAANVTASGNVVMPFLKPVPVAAGDTIELLTNQPDTFVSGTVNGWEE
jgi:hypothetical protein